MTNITNLRDQLCELFEDVKNGKADIEKAKSMTNISGKIIKSAQVELQYNQFLKEDRKIKFLEQ